MVVVDGQGEKNDLCGLSTHYIHVWRTIDHRRVKCHCPQKAIASLATNIGVHSMPPRGET